jgi:hypothetical protein
VTLVKYIGYGGKNLSRHRLQRSAQEQQRREPAGRHSCRMVSVRRRRVPKTLLRLSVVVVLVGIALNLFVKLLGIAGITLIALRYGIGV